MPHPDAFVLAGGRSARMGADKAAVAFGSGTLLDRVVASLVPAAGRVRVVRRTGQDAVPYETVWEPDDGDRHPLAGVVSALSAAGTPTALIAPVDLPLAPPELWALLRDAGPCVAAAAGVVQPLVCHLPRSALADAVRLRGEGAGAWALVHGLPRIVVPERWIADCDDPDTLRALLVEPR